MTVEDLKEILEHVGEQLEVYFVEGEFRLPIEKLSIGWDVDSKTSIVKLETE